MQEWFDQAMKSPPSLLLTLLLLQAGVSGCHTATQPVQFSEIPDYMMGGLTEPRAAMVDLEVLGARPGVDRTALVKGTRKALGPSSAAFPEQEKMSDAQKLADRVLAGNKVTLRLPPDLANAMALALKEAGFIVRVSE